MGNTQKRNVFLDKKNFMGCDGAQGKNLTQIQRDSVVYSF